ncbi:hypothetical protein M9458_017336, partial [Cirrhinus mrigala]
MDPPPTTPSTVALQKTSPPMDPATASAPDQPSVESATVRQLTTELTAQASRLFMHEQQLDRLTDLTAQLVRALQGLQLVAPTATPPVTSPPPGAQSAPSSPRLAFPEKFDGTPAKCKGFLLQCSLFVNQQPHMYPTDKCKIAFVCSLLTGRALEWATAVWRLDRPTFPSFAAFLQKFKEVFQPSTESGEAGELIMALRQGRRTAADYALSFRTLAAQSGWNDEPLKLHYLKGLHPDLQVELACRDENLSLEAYIDLSIRVDSVMRARKPGRLPTPVPAVAPANETAPEPMQLGATKLSLEERERRLRGNLGLYCGLAGHIRANCPTRLPRQPSSVSDLNRYQTTVSERFKLGFEGRVVKTTALIDSGAAGNFIDVDFVIANHLPTLSCSPHVAVAALDGFITPPTTSPFRSNPRTRRPYVSSSSRHHNRHGPSIAWANRTITHWSPFCQQHCLQPTTRPQDAQGPHTTRSTIPTDYQDLLEAFSCSKATRLPPHRPGDCAIDLIPGTTPPRGRVFPLSRAESEAMNSYIQEELAKGFITPSTSPASAGFFFVKKKDRGLRPCIDYRGLNEVTVKYRYPLPLVPSALEQLRSARIFTKLDLRSAYNLIRIRAGDEWKTAFSTTSGHYEYRVMPFGLANSPSYFQAFINEVFRDMLNRWVIVYIDDILIYSNSLSEHICHVRAVLQRLITHQLYAKEEKCEFHQDKVSFLGYIISADGVAMDERKVSAVLRWPRPNTLKELQRFLGFANFYRRFIRHFSSVAAPLTTMVRRGTSRLAWSQPALQAFDDLRRRFSTAPILHHPDPDRPFIVEVDASSTGGEPAKMFPCAYYSHKLSPTERNYDVGNRELLAIKLALEEWRHWLEGSKHPFTVLTDHKNLEYLRSAKVLNHRQARWSLLFTHFQFQVSYCPGTQNTKADALSRIYEPGQPIASSESILPATMIIADLTSDPGPLSSRLPRESHVCSPVPAATCPSPGSLNSQFGSPSNRFWWPTVRSDTIQFVRNCAICNASKVPHRLPAGLLQPLPVPQRPWSHIALDFVTDLPLSNGHTTILSVVDRFSKGCRFIPLPKIPTAMETAEHLCNWVFRFYGLPEDIVSDRGPQFTSRLWSSFFHLLGVNVSLTSGYHPQANGQAERLNQELTRFLRSYCLDHQEDWSRYLFWAEYAQNSLFKPATNLTPFQCTLGFQPPLFPWSGEPSDLPAVNSWFQRSEEPSAAPSPNPPYKPSQWVWLSTRDLRLRLPCKKLCPRYVGPFKIIKQITPVSFRLDLPAEYRISPTFHVSLFKPAGAPEGVENLDETAPQGPPSVIIDNEEVYRVNTILDSRRRRGHLQYLVDWEGFGPEERSWVAARDILDPSLTTEFHAHHPDRPAPRGRGRPRRVARRGRALSLMRSLWLPLTAASGNHPRTFNYVSHHPVPGTRASGSGSLGTLPLWRPFIDYLCGRFLAKFWLVLLTILSVFHCIYCLFVADRTVCFLPVILAACLSSPAWIIVVVLDYLLCSRLLLFDPRLLLHMDPPPTTPSTAAAVFGEEADKHTIVLFTHGDELTGSVEEFAKANEALKEILSRCGGGYHVFNNKDVEDRSQVVEFLQKVDAVVAANGGEYYTSDSYQDVENMLKTKPEELKKLYEKKLQDIERQLEARFAEEMKKLQERIETLTASEQEKEEKIKELERQNKCEMTEYKQYYKSKIREARQEAEQT